MYKQFTLIKLRSAMVVAALIALAACSTISNVDEGGKTDQPVFPRMSDASMPEGYYVNQDNLVMMRAGMTKKQVMALIGHPQFSEGMFGVREWDYIFKFRQAEGRPDKVCQYKVLFDKDTLVRSLYFNPTGCMSSSASMLAAEPTKPMKNMELSADTSFGFDSASLRPAGRASLDKLVTDLNQVSLDSIDVVGHADRLGSAAYNQRLSLERADAVRNYLVRKGVPGSQISARGVGAAYPLVSCPGAKSSEIVKCLARNRRTTITIHAE